MTGGWLAEGSWPHRCSTRGAQLLGIAPVKGNGLPKGKGLPKVRWFLRDGRWIIAPTRYSPGNTRLLGRMARSGDRAPQAVYRKCRGLRGTGCPARHWPCAKRGKRRKSLCPRIKFALSPSIEVKGFRKLQKSFSLLDRARPVFSFSALRKRENGGCNEPAIIMAEIPLPVRASKIPPSRQGFPLQINLPPI